MKQFEGKVAIVTGAASGIGKDTARRLASEGCSVILSDIDPEVVQVAKDIMVEVPGSECIGVEADVAKVKEVDGLVAKAVEKFGKLDIMFNNAGVVQSMSEVVDTTDETFDRVMNVNFRGVFNGCRAAMRQMIKQGSGGHIINTSSYFGKSGHSHFAIYCSSKAAVLNFTRSLALEAINYGIFVNAICPGNMYTKMHVAHLTQEAELGSTTLEDVVMKYRKAIPLQRHGTGDDVANAVVFLCSNQSNYIIGESLNVSGGLEMR